MQKKHVFLTGSSYEGSWKKETRCMNVFGTYTYPDRSEYRGYFQNGKFHGYGRLTLAAPYNFTVEGVFDNGTLESITHMWFHDGLTISNPKITNNNLEVTNWKYCTENDRRYVRELIYGLEPVEPNGIITADESAKKLEKTHYDTVEGIFDERTGFVTGRVQPFTNWRFIDCESEKDWMRKHCRHSAKIHKEPLPEEQREILENNLQTAVGFQKRLDRNQIKQDTCKRYFYKLCEKEREQGAECKISDPEVLCPITSELSACPSFGASSINKDSKDKCENVQAVKDVNIPETHEEVLMRRHTYDNTHIIVHFDNSL